MAVGLRCGACASEGLAPLVCGCVWVCSLLLEYMHVSQAELPRANKEGAVVIVVTACRWCFLYDGLKQLNVNGKTLEQTFLEREGLSV